MPVEDFWRIAKEGPSNGGGAFDESGFIYRISGQETLPFYITDKKIALFFYGMTNNMIKSRVESILKAFPNHQIDAYYVISSSQPSKINSFINRNNWEVVLNFTNQGSGSNIYLVRKIFNPNNDNKKRKRFFRWKDKRYIYTPLFCGGLVSWKNKMNEYPFTSRPSAFHVGKEIPVEKTRVGKGYMNRMGLERKSIVLDEMAYGEKFMFYYLGQKDEKK